MIGHSEARFRADHREDRARYRWSGHYELTSTLKRLIVRARNAPAKRRQEVARDQDVS
jgi:hypothetical protein